MGQFVRFSVLAVVVVCLSTAAAHAMDWCFDSNGLAFVAQEFAKPGKGSCRALLGHHLTNPVTGVACLTSDGTTLRVAYAVHFGDRLEDGRLTLPHPALTGGTSDSVLIDAGGTIHSTGPASAALCNPLRQPIP